MGSSLVQLGMGARPAFGHGVDQHRSCFDLWCLARCRAKTPARRGGARPASTVPDCQRLPSQTARSGSAQAAARCEQRLLR
eukprot:7396170-Alexandrium_andersonii.AAC.1